MLSWNLNYRNFIYICPISTVRHDNRSGHNDTTLQEIFSGWFSFPRGAGKGQFWKSMNRITMQNISIDSKIILKSLSQVLLAELRNTEYYYAVKCLKKDVVLEDDDVECTLIERKVLALGTKHPYLCHLFCTFQTEVSISTCNTRQTNWKREITMQCAVNRQITSNFENKCCFSRLSV